LIGYPDEISSYEDISENSLDEENIIKNYILLLEYNYNGWRHTIGKPQIPGVWQMHAHVINAYCDFERNEIVFPAAILQPPFYDPNGLMAHNYGGIGAIIGHEITHAFDDQGSQFDAFGRTVDWWTPRDRKEFELRTQKIVNQFDGIKMAGVYVNGSLTQGENIADLGGLLTAYDAMMDELNYGSYKEESFNQCHNDYGLDLTYAKQQFFVAWALVWRETLTEEALRDQILTDSHAPHKLRINMPLSNMSEFYEAFHVRKGDRLYRDEKDRVKIW
jgi:putative endopeptidase